jgi:hypothetical protein
MAMFRRSSEQEIPELGDMYQFNLGLTPLHREDFIEQLAGYNDEETERLSGLSDDELIEEMRGSYCNDIVTEELDRLKADKISGRVFVFHEGKDEIDRLIFDNERLGVYDSHRSEWGFFPERVKELELREKVKKTTKAVERRKIWKEIRQLNQQANELEEALTEIVPIESQHEIQEGYGGRLLLDFIASTGNCPDFDVVESEGLAIKGGHPHNSLVSQHYLELTLQRLRNVKYELVPLKKHFGTDAVAVSEWADQARHLDVAQYTDSGELVGDAELARIVDAYKFGERHNDQDFFPIDENVDEVLVPAEKLVKKLYKGGGLNQEEKDIVSFYEKMIKGEETGESQEVQRRFNWWWRQKLDYHDPESFWGKEYGDMKTLEFESWGKIIKYEENKFTGKGLMTSKQRVRARIANDFQTLKAYKGYHALFRDLEGVRDNGFYPEKEIPYSQGSSRVDVRLEHILFRGFNEEGAPQFSIIDMYHLGSSELEYKKRIHGDTTPKLSLHP